MVLRCWEGKVQGKLNRAVHSSAVLSMWDHTANKGRLGRREARNPSGCVLNDWRTGYISLKQSKRGPSKEAGQLPSIIRKAVTWLGDRTYSRLVSRGKTNALFYNIQFWIHIKRSLQVTITGHSWHRFQEWLWHQEWLKTWVAIDLQVYPPAKALKSATVLLNGGP